MTSTEIEKGFSLIGLKSELQLDSFLVVLLCQQNLMTLGIERLAKSLNEV